MGRLGLLKNAEVLKSDNEAFIGWGVSFIDFLDKSPKTVKAYTGGIRKFLRWITEEGITSPDYTDIIRYKRYLKSEGYEPTTVQSYLTAVRVFFSWLEVNRLYPDIARRVKGDRINPEPKRDYLTADQARDILRSIDRSNEKGLRAYAVIALALCCGLRCVEISRANKKDFRQRGENTVLYIQGKGKADRQDFVIVPIEVQKAIEDYLCTRKGVKAKDPLFSSIGNRNKGGRLTPDTISRIIKGCMISSGYDSDRLTAHSCRHSAATISLEQGGSLEAVQQFVRHSRTDTTLIYVHSLKKDSNQCSRMVSSAIFGERGT